MKTILFPTDFSPLSVNALGFATAMARLISARIVFLYAVRSFADRDRFIANTPIDNESQAMEAMKQLSAQVSGEIPCEYLVKTGSVNDEIASTAKATKADLVVMGTAGAGEIPDTLALLNSTTTDLISKRICPILAVPAEATIPGFSKIVLAVDTGPVANTILEFVLQIARGTRAEVLLLRVTGEKQLTAESQQADTHTSVEHALAGVTYSAHTIHSDEVTDSIQQFAQAQGAGLITVVSRKKGIFDTLFGESVSQKLALRSQIPLLVLPE
jgi:nucleotide-binding universal stress UspA family protein